MRRSRHFLWIAVLAAVAVIALTAVLRTPLPPSNDDPGSGCGVRVVEDLGERLLVVDGLIRGSVDPETGECLLPSSNAAGLAGRLFEVPGRVLLVGIGDGSAARRFAGKGWRVDAVEPDPRVAWAAAWHGGLDADDASLVLGDPRTYLETHDGPWEIVLVSDAASIDDPGRLVTREAFGLVAARLAAGGVAVVDLETAGWRSPLVRAVAATLGSSFPRVLALPTMEPPNALGRVVLLAADRPLELPEELDNPVDRFTAQYQRVHAWANRFEPETAGAPVLTDRRNPARRWFAETRALSRERLADRLGAATP